MFEPENDIERMLVRASAEPAERPGFARALLDTEIFMVLIPEGAPIVPGPDGKVTVPEGTRLTLPSAMRGDEQLIPFFSARSRVRAWFSGEHIVAPELTRNLFGRYPDAPFVLNPGSDYGKEFGPEEAQRMLGGQFEDGPQTITTKAPEDVLLAHPVDIPHALIAALGRELGAVKSVHGSWLMLAQRAREPEQSWMVGVDHDGSWNDVRAAISRALAGDMLGGRMLDAMPLDDGPLSSTLRTGIPVTAARSGFIQ
jgi:type III secretion system (T3SS) SseB-like protein